MSGQNKEGHSSRLLTNPRPASTTAADVPLPSTVHGWQGLPPWVGYRTAKVIQLLSALPAQQAGAGWMEEGNPCGACWGSETEGALRVKRSFSSWSLFSRNASLPFFPGCLSPQGRPLSRQSCSLSSGVGGSQ